LTIFFLTQEEYTMALFKKDVAPTPEAASAEAEPAITAKRGPGRPKGKLGRPKGSGKRGRKPGRPAMDAKRGRKPGVAKAGVIGRQVAKALKAERKAQKALITAMVAKEVQKALKEALR
jgi:hypothetical protein